MVDRRVRDTSAVFLVHALGLEPVLEDPLYHKDGDMWYRSDLGIVKMDTGGTVVDVGGNQLLDVKDAVRVATTTDITLSGTQSIDDVDAIVGDRVLVKNQVVSENNGIYIVAEDVWARSTDANTNAKVKSGMFMFIEEGTTHADSGWILSTNNPIVLGTTPLTFAQFTGSSVIPPLDNNIDDSTIVLIPTNILSVGLGKNNKGISGLNVKDFAITAHGVPNATPSDEVEVLAGSIMVGGAIHTWSGGILPTLAQGTNQIDFDPQTNSIVVTPSGSHPTNMFPIGIVNISAGGLVTSVTDHRTLFSLPCSVFITRMTPTGDVDGVNTTFGLSTPNIATGSEHVFLNGLLQDSGLTNDYVISAGNLIFNTAPLAGSKIRVSYRLDISP